jgi:Icc-related predicted phosphoesterase
MGKSKVARRSKAAVRRVRSTSTGHGAGTPTSYTFPTPSLAFQAQTYHRQSPAQPRQPLPVPTGLRPYQLRLEQVLGDAAVTAIKQSGQLTFQSVGDTGGINYPFAQQAVAQSLEGDMQLSPAPAFLYHLGDVVYFAGEKNHYYPQFYEPYAEYHAPIFAIPGNHDGDVAQGSSDPSLAGFVENFCARQPHRTSESQEVPRDAMVQPNVYWTLIAPFATIVGVYTNCPEGGYVDSEQAAWLEEEMAKVPDSQALIVALHHPIYSLSGTHTGSQQMGNLLADAITVSKRVPDLVLTGHVHNYQRFTDVVNGRQMPVIVAGAGGYWHQHPVMKDPKTGKRLKTPYKVDAHTSLENFCDDHHGYLRLVATAKTIKGAYVQVPSQKDPVGTKAKVVDAWSVDLAKHVVA